jgi:hypothetical protein
LGDPRDHRKVRRKIENVEERYIHRKLDQTQVTVCESVKAIPPPPNYVELILTVKGGKRTCALSALTPHGLDKTDARGPVGVETTSVTVYFECQPSKDLSRIWTNVSMERGEEGLANRQEGGRDRWWSREGDSWPEE